MLGKNPFRWFLFIVVAIVVAKLCYNLGSRLINGRQKPQTEAQGPNSGAYRRAQGLRGVTVDPADSAAAAADTAGRVQ